MAKKPIAPPKKVDPYGRGPANFLKASTKRNYGASPTNFLNTAKKRSAGSAPSEPVSP